MQDQDNKQSSGKVSPVLCRESYIEEIIPVKLILMETSAVNEQFDIFKYKCSPPSPAIDVPDFFFPLYFQQMKSCHVAKKLLLFFPKHVSLHFIALNSILILFLYLPIIPCFPCRNHLCHKSCCQQIPLANKRSL